MDPGGLAKSTGHPSIVWRKELCGHERFGTHSAHILTQRVQVPKEGALTQTRDKYQWLPIRDAYPEGPSTLCSNTFNANTHTGGTLRQSISYRSAWTLWHSLYSGTHSFDYIDTWNPTFDYQNQFICGLPIISIQGFVTGTPQNDG